MPLNTPYYLIDEKALLSNLKKIRYVRERSGAKSVLALKCFSTWSVFGLMKKYMDGTTSSSLFETKIGREKFGKETHAYCVAFSKDDIKEVKKYADKIIFNSISQLKTYRNLVGNLKIGLRINPKISYSHFDLADPARRYSRLGVVDKNEIKNVLPFISGAMFHFNCENDDFGSFSRNLDYLHENYGSILKELGWVSLGGGFYFTKEGYPLDRFCDRLREFSNKLGVQVYLEPGETSITRSAELVTKVLDVIHNEIDIAVVDSSTEAHMLDLLIYRTPAKIETSGKGRHKYMIAGRSCLAGDVFGTYRFRSPLRPGKIIRISDAAGYTMVKKNWFNGLQMPAIAVKRLDGTIDIVRRFAYKDYLNSLS
ncbi:MAG: carboxynorspermidine decarboxylase [Endomicrobiales bacterium]|nr:carboxynorspermidine decarboxylase [Endomicrobiales bacterium]